MKFSILDDIQPLAESWQHTSRSQESHSAAFSPPQVLAPVLCQDSVSLCGHWCGQHLGAHHWLNWVLLSKALHSKSTSHNPCQRRQNYAVWNLSRLTWAVLTCCLRTSSWVLISSMLLLSPFSGGVPTTGGCCFCNASRRACTIKQQNY